MAALSRARHHLDRCGAKHVTLIATGGLRREGDFVKALALGADAIAVSNAALQAIGCLGMRACHTNNCPVGIATQKESLRARLKIEQSAKQLSNYFEASTELMKILARACGHARFADFNRGDLTSWKKEIAELAGVRYAGIG
jgi:glutamate synthase domain-containing protein 2